MAEQTAEVFLRQLERLSSFPTDFDEEFFDKFAESYLPTGADKRQSVVIILASHAPDCFACS